MSCTAAFFGRQYYCVYMIRKIGDRITTFFILLLTVLGFAALAFVIYFIVREALPLFETVPLKDFLLGQRWMPIDYGNGESFGIFNFICATLFVSLLAMVIASFIGLGASVFLSCVCSKRTRELVYPLIDLLAGIPSVIYGFIGIVVLLKFFLKAGVHTGSCVLAASILLGVMLLPFIVSSCSETILKEKNKYLKSAESLGISKWYAISSIILPASFKNILYSMVLAIGRAMGETMAVMMVIGNANLFPKLLGKGESIASVIALEMGTAVVGSNHYHALYAAGLVLMVLVFIINTVIMTLRNRLLRKEND